MIRVTTYHIHILFAYGNHFFQAIRTTFFSSLLSSFRPTLANASQKNNKDNGDDFGQTAVTQDQDVHSRASR
jgi:hypothetical protein